MSADSFARTDKLLIYGNLLINNESKFQALKFTLPGWLNYWQSNCVLRVRGEYSLEVLEFCKALDRVRILVGSELIQWRKQTLSDLSSIKCDYVMLYLEDHMLGASPPKSRELISEFYKYGVEIFQYSWFQQYDQLRVLLESKNVNCAVHGIYAKIDKPYKNEIRKTKFPWIVSMTSVFEYNYLLKLLTSNRPYLRKFDPKAPYELEQRPNSSWYLPVVYGLSKDEMGICLDDDNSISNSSAFARGLFKGSIAEKAQNHDSSISIIHIVRKFPHTRIGAKLKQILPMKARRALKNPVLWWGYFIYSIQALFYCSSDYLMMKYKK